MHYYIDGYNLLFRIMPYDDSLKRQREQLIDDVGNKIVALNIDVTFVFDAQYQDGDTSRTYFKQCHIIFSSRGETADEAILAEIKAEQFPKQHVVVTSDKKLAWFARRCSAKTESVEEFISWLNKRYKNHLLRQKKGQILKPNFPPPPASIKTVAKPKPVLPSPEALPEQCVDYYLECFTKMLDSAPVKKKSQKTKSSKTKKSKKSFEDEPAEEKGVNDFDRWLGIFVDRLKDNGA